MSRRDTIVIAVLINACLLALLFFMAVNTHDEQLLVHTQTLPPQRVEFNEQQFEQEMANVTFIPDNPHDEIDHVLKNYAVAQEPVAAPIALVQEPVKPKLEEKPAPEPKRQPEQQYKEITVKRGDALSKIALTHHTTVKEIMAANHLRSARIDVGQVLRVPIDTKGKGTSSLAVVAQAVQEKESPEFYVVQRGDNPWTLAKKFHVKFEDLLIMNNLNEDKARNLKVGDQLRVR